MPAEEFNSMVGTLIKQKKSADVTLYEEAERNWNEIVSAEYLFDRFAREIQILEGIQSKEEMVDALAEFRYEKRGTGFFGVQSKVWRNRCQL